MMKNLFFVITILVVSVVLTGFLTQSKVSSLHHRDMEISQHQLIDISGEIKRVILAKRTAREEVKIFAEKYNTTPDIIQLINEKAKKYALPKEMVYNLIETESKFRPEAVNNQNTNGTVDRGLMQINSRYAPWFAQKVGIDNFNYKMLFQPEINLEIGMWYLKSMYNRYHNWHAVLTAYNKGPTGMKRYYRRTGAYQSRYSAVVLSE
ncbi:transglycosylase SLT domain-containing protein [Metallumcola ferriviriculae]|uniref:Transglycosylase SLT domain-containing protein n=1 Tax=Metallumcola ferriviriculae TaxID=3039180 RepID=A0AAU0UKX3_9FIRM|nr:transglycosylase SLT domain-containing protein [Desulfitibacteraceae bacterium MK1]